MWKHAVAATIALILFPSLSHADIPQGRGHISLIEFAFGHDANVDAFGLPWGLMGFADPISEEEYGRRKRLWHEALRNKRNMPKEEFDERRRLFLEAKRQRRPSPAEAPKEETPYVAPSIPSDTFRTPMPIERTAPEDERVLVGLSLLFPGLGHFFTGKVGTPGTTIAGGIHLALDLTCIGALIGAWQLRQLDRLDRSTFTWSIGILVSSIILHRLESFLEICDWTDAILANSRGLPHNKSAFLACGLSLLLPGVGHLYIGTPGAIQSGVIQVALEIICSAAIIGLSIANPGGPFWIFSAMLVVHRIHSMIESAHWCHNVNTARISKPKVSFYYLPDGRGHEFGAALSMRFG
jgi:hypothetical protein